MLGVAIGLIVIAALGAWIVALLSALSIVGQAPAGQKWKSWSALGGWRFDEIRAIGGVAVEPHLKRFQLAFAAFFVVVIAAAALGVLLGADQQNNTHEDAAVLAHSYSPTLES
ncbi:MAG: hypothetical protein EON57_16745 [Alphaproteobacteria bacterium]|nr:MAG: hypothetical protein EON57_16745 [Alphaproteobacteria bacterium]